MQKIDWIALGELIKDRRKKKDLTQLELAAALGTNQPSISLIEKGSPVGLTDDRQVTLFSLLEISNDEIPYLASSQPSVNRKKVFISYSHKDKTYLDRLSVHLKPLEKKGLIDVWSDTKIFAGNLWKDEIENALRDAQVAVLLVSADFLASDFITDNELPPIIERAKDDGVIVLSVILKPCRFSREKTLSKFQAINSPAEPVSGMDEHGRELIYDAIAQRIEDFLPV